jgi:hypothetical protein
VWEGFMRRKERAIHNQPVILEHLRICHIGRLGTIGKDGYPRVKPLCFAYHDGHIYFHTAKQGERVEDKERFHQRTAGRCKAISPQLPAPVTALPVSFCE